MDDTPTWLKIMENGSVGEARTRAFLIDRFWVLERSVDVNGADFLVQRRTTSQRFTDKAPPRLGVVQAKYFQDRRTTHYIARSYVVDETGQPLEGFFALLHVGREDKAEMYLLSASDIVRELSISGSRTPESYVVGTAAIAKRFKVGTLTTALDRIEHSLKIQSYDQVTAVLDRLNIPYRDFVDDNIDYEWTAPLPNPMANVPQLFREKKEELRRIVFEIEEVLETIDQIFVARDPERALALMDELHDHVDVGGRLTFGYFADFRWEDLQDALTVHKRWREGLVRDSLLDAYITLGTRLRKSLQAKLVEVTLANIDDFLEVDLRFDPTLLTINHLTIAAGIKGEQQPQLIQSDRIRMGRRVFELPARSGPVRESSAELARHLWTFVMRAVIELRYPEPY